MLWSAIIGLLLLIGCSSLDHQQPTPVSNALPPTVTLTVTSPPTLTPTATATPSPSPTPTNTPEPTPTPILINHVVIISIDGLRPDALAQADTPTFDNLQAQGAYQPQAQAVYPSVTLINHASMLTGMVPEGHGINWNVTDPSLGYVNGPTLFTVMHEAGLSTAMIVGKPKLEHIAIPGSVDTYIYAGYTDSQVIQQAIQVTETTWPNLLFIHLPDVDSTGHLVGWMSQTQLWTINATDSLIGRFIDHLEDAGYLETTLLIVTSDHGGTEQAHGQDIPEHMTIPWLAVGPNVSQNVILTHDINIYDTAATVLHVFDLPLPETWDGQPVLEIFGQ